MLLQKVNEQGSSVTILTSTHTGSYGLNRYFGSLQACLQELNIKKKAFKTFFLDLALECLQAQGEAPPLLLRKFGDVINIINICAYVYVKWPRMKVAHYIVNSLFFS